MRTRISPYNPEEFERKLKRRTANFFQVEVDSEVVGVAGLEIKDDLAELDEIVVNRRKQAFA